MKACALLLLLAATVVGCNAFHEDFSAGWEKRWIHSGESRHCDIESAPK